MSGTRRNMMALSELVNSEEVDFEREEDQKPGHGREGHLQVTDSVPGAESVHNETVDPHLEGARNLMHISSSGRETSSQGSSRSTGSTSASEYLPPLGQFEKSSYYEATGTRKTTTLRIEHLPCFDQLNLYEQEFCSGESIKPQSYIDVRGKMFERFHQVTQFDADGRRVPEERPRWKKTEAQKVKGLNVNNISKMWDWYDRMGLWQHSWQR